MLFKSCLVLCKLRETYLNSTLSPESKRYLTNTVMVTHPKVKPGPYSELQPQKFETKISIPSFIIWMDISRSVLDLAQNFVLQFYVRYLSNITWMDISRSILDLYLIYLIYI